MRFENILLILEKFMYWEYVGLSVVLVLAEISFVESGPDLKILKIFFDLPKKMKANLSRIEEKSFWRKLKIFHQRAIDRKIFDKM